MHHRNAVAPFPFVHEVGREEDRHAVVTRQADQILPEGIAGDRVDTGGRLVENQHLGPVQDRDGKLKTLFHAERQAFGPAVRNAEQTEPFEHFLNPSLSPVFRQAKQVGM